MKQIFLALLLGLVALPALAAQTITQTLAWTQPGDSLTDIQAYIYTLTLNGAAPVTLTATCVQPVATNPVTCTAPIPTLPAGSDTLVLTARDAFGATPSAPLVGVVPSAAINLTVTLTITQGP